MVLEGRMATFEPKLLNVLDFLNHTYMALEDVFRLE